jgi:serine/threonine-protein kinase HipA
MKEPRKGEVFFDKDLAGYISETPDGYIFEYDKEYFKKNIPISASMPFSDKPYSSKELFPFFKGLLPEGWYLDIVAATQKVDREDSFGLLLATAGGDTIGAVTVRKVK